MDIVRVFKDYCDNNDFFFGYGTTFIQNLLTNPQDHTADKIHLLLEPVRRRSEISSGGLNVTTRLYSGKYLLVLRDDYDLHYFNEKGSNPATSKYTTRIEPLLTVYAALEKRLMACDGFDVVFHDNIDITDVLDANMTGLLCNFQIRQFT